MSGAPRRLWTERRSQVFTVQGTEDAESLHPLGSASNYQTSNTHDRHTETEAAKALALLLIPCVHQRIKPFLLQYVVLYSCRSETATVRNEAIARKPTSTAASPSKVVTTGHTTISLYGPPGIHRCVHLVISESSTFTLDPLANKPVNDLEEHWVGMTLRRSHHARFVSIRAQIAPAERTIHGDGTLIMSSSSRLKGVQPTAKTKGG